MPYIKYKVGSYYSQPGQNLLDGSMPLWHASDEEREEIRKVSHIEASKDSGASDQQTIAWVMVRGRNLGAQMILQGWFFFRLILFHLCVQEFLLKRYPSPWPFAVTANGSAVGQLLPTPSSPGSCSRCSALPAERVTRVPAHSKIQKPAA